MNEIAEKNRLIKRAVKITQRKLANVQNQGAEKTQNNIKSGKKKD